MAVSLSIGVTQNSQSIENNTSNVTVVVYASWTYGSHNQLQKSGSVTIDGSTYSFTSSFNYNGTSSGSQAIWTGTVNVAHNTDGTKTLSCSASYVTGVSSGTIYASTSVALTTIPRKSTLTASNGTLGTAQTLTINRNSDSFYHRITYACGEASGSVTSDRITSTSISWTPPLSLAAQNTASTNVSVTFTLYTYAGDGTELGTTTKTISCAIPASVKPTVSLSVSDSMGYLATYGGYLQGLSKISVSITAAGVQGSTIKTYNTTADGKNYASASFTTDVISGTGTLTISTTVTDTRGRTATASTNITVLAYSSPKITAMDIYRSDSSGSATSNGAYLTVKFSAAITSISSKNTASYAVQHKKTSSTSYTSATLSSYANVYSVSNGTYTFAADASSTYDIIFTATDAFNSTQRIGSGGTVSKLFSILNKGLGWAFGKVAEKQKTVEIADGWNLEVGGNVYSGGVQLKPPKRCYVGQNSSTNTNPWYKFASITETGAVADNRISFKVTYGYGGSVKYGILNAAFRTDSSGAFSSGNIVFESSTGMDTSNFVMAYGSGNYELWVKMTAYIHCQFEVLSETNRMNFVDKWTLYNQSSAGYAESPTSGYTQITSLCSGALMAYPVGAYYIAHNDTSPAELFGGTWHRIESRFLWACPSTSTIGLTAGEMTHTLTIDEMPSHYHYIDNTGLAWFNAQGSGSNQMWFNASGYAQSWSQYAGGSAAHNNMPPYVNVAIWRRTA